ncbi:protein of unknown function [Trichlorobacter ammonificans]|uniref:Uncharacterized protein n=1 Tax=Trichlorobacter ammonificans TaxID=2916410 RepID=A0ABN8HH95_9BACT|nr:protein of unknown function [Trichlorobacter ammonificans]
MVTLCKGHCGFSRVIAFGEQHATRRVCCKLLPVTLVRSANRKRYQNSCGMAFTWAAVKTGPSLQT